MSTNDGPYFPLDARTSLAKPQAEVHGQLRRCLSELQPTFLPPGNTTAVREQNGTLTLTARHSGSSEVTVAMAVDEYGRLDVLCECLHTTFELCFNDKWEPHDCLGELAYGLKVVAALFEGRIESKVVSSRKRKSVAKSEDWMTDESGDRIRLYVQYHGQAIVDALFGRHCEIRRISFMEEQGLIVCNC